MRIEGACLALPVVEVRRRDREARHAGKRGLRRHMEHPDQPIRIGKRIGRSSTLLTMLKMAALAPMPSASTVTTESVNDGARSSTRTP